MILTGSEWDHVTHYSRETVVLQSVHRYVIITNNYHFLCLGDLILFFNIELKNLHEWKKSRKHMLNVKEYNMKNVNYYLFFLLKISFCLLLFVPNIYKMRTAVKCKIFISILLLLMFYFAYCPVLYLAGHLIIQWTNRSQVFVCFWQNMILIAILLICKIDIEKIKTPIVIFSFCKLIAVSIMFSLEIK